jgi:predicted GTPase
VCYLYTCVRARTNVFVCWVWVLRLFNESHSHSLTKIHTHTQVVEWFSERADRILLLFDAHKLDISDEFKSAIESIRGNDDKIRVVLNKCDMAPQKLLRVCVVCSV